MALLCQGVSTARSGPLCWWPECPNTWARPRLVVSRVRPGDCSGMLGFRRLCCPGGYLGGGREGASHKTAALTSHRLYNGLQHIKILLGLVLKGYVPVIPRDVLQILHKTHRRIVRRARRQQPPDLEHGGEHQQHQVIQQKLGRCADRSPSTPRENDPDNVQQQKEVYDGAANDLRTSQRTPEYPTTEKWDRKEIAHAP